MKVEMSCMEVDGAGWSWMHSLVIPVLWFKLKCDCKKNVSISFNIH